MRKTVVFGLMSLLLFTAANAWAVQYEIHDLGTLSGYVSFYGNSINNRGQVVGTAYNSSGTTAQAFVWDAENGIRPIGGEGSYAYQINNNGVALGGSSSGTFMWSNESGRYNPGIRDMAVSCINDFNQVGGSY